MTTKQLKASEVLQQESGVNLAWHTEFYISTCAHCHDFMELFIIESGKIGHFINEEKQYLKKGSLVFIRPKDIHYYFSLDSDCKLINLAFPLAIFEEVKKISGLEKQFDKLLEGPCKSVMLSTLRTNEVINKMYSAGHSQITKPELALAQFKSLIFNIFINTLLNTGAVSEKNETTPVPQWLEQLCQDMEKKKNYMQGLPAMKKLANYSQEHLCRIFKRYLKKTPTTFINELRLEAAATMLRSSNEKIYSIAMDNGFESLSHFYHKFKKQFELSPGKYRKQFLKNAIPKR